MNGLRKFLPVILMVLFVAPSGCAPQPSPAPDARLKVIATTSILADVVKNVGGDYISLATLVPTGVDEHEYQPAPRDVAAAANADVIFQVGLGLEQFMSTVVQNAGGSADVVTVSDGIEVKQFQGLAQADHADAQFSGDPHVWMDPANVIIWVQNIQAALNRHDPAHQAQYQQNASDYIVSLQELDTWITGQTSLIPSDQRKIVTDHMLFGYFAEKYGFEVIGALIPSYSSAAQSSARELADLEDAIRSYGVKSILLGENVNPSLAQRVAQDTGINLVYFYTGSLSAPDGPASTYLDYMRYNVTTIVKAFSP